MLDKLIKKIIGRKRGEKGMTGMETATILIAFVTVAAVFGYTVLSSGIFSAERGREVIFAGLLEARRGLQLSGSVIAKGTPTTADNVTTTEGKANAIVFTIKNVLAGMPIDMTPNSGATEGHNKCVISLTTANYYDNNVTWSFVPTGNDNGNNLLEPGEQFEITVDLTNLGELPNGDPFMDPQLKAGDTFSIEVKPSTGPTIMIQRKLPPAIDSVMDLH